MNKGAEPKKYRKLSVAALITGILSFSTALLYNFLWMPILIFLRNVVGPNIIPIIILTFIRAALGLSIAAVVCGCIDLNRIKKGFYNNKGKIFDITGIVLGGIIILVAIIFMLGEIIFSH
jgi:hypothetical protein